MQIRVSRSGGFAGLTEELGAVDTATLGADRAGAVERLVRDADFFALPETLPATGIGADQFQYSITVVDNDRRHTVSFRDGGAPTPGESRAVGPLPALQRLLDAVQRGR